MSSNEKVSRKSRYSQKQYENSSVYNHSVKSELNNLSIDLPRNQKKYAKIEREIIEKQRSGRVATINLANTKYPVMQEVCGVEGLNWKMETFTQSRNWNIKWCDTGVTNEMLQRMQYQQKINHFPNMGIIARKNALAVTLSNMKEIFPQDYDFFPRTFLYPNDYGRIKHYYLQSRKRGLVKTFIVKPEAGCQGRGIYLTQNPADFQKEERCVIQKYISNPLLYKGLKFDLRIYVLLSRCYPLQIYLYNEGLVRFATEKYELPQPKNLDNYFLHLTNYAINKSNPNYEYNYSVNDMSYGHKKSLAEFFKSLKEMGYRANVYWSQIKDQIIKTLIAAQPMLVANYRNCRPTQPTYNMCFEVLGFDFMMDNQDRCYLLEVNHTPSFATDTPLDHIIKKNLLKDTLGMMNPSQQQINLREELQRMRQRQKYVKFKHGNDNTNQAKQNIVGLINEARNKQELQNKGTYELIYPTKNEAKMAKYRDFQVHSSKLVHRATSSTSTIPTVSDLRNRLKQIPKNKISNRQIIKENITKNMAQQGQSKKNLIYNYNYIKKDRDAPSKKTLVTLPAEPYRMESHPKEKSSGKNSRAMSTQRFKIQKSNTHHIQPEYTREVRYPAKSEERAPRKDFMFSKASGSRAGSGERQGGRELSNFEDRIRAYKTPLMF